MNIASRLAEKKIEVNVGLITPSIRDGIEVAYYPRYLGTHQRYSSSKQMDYAPNKLQQYN